MRLLPRFNMKREVWPGGPQLGQVVEAQLNPQAQTAAAAPVPPASVSVPDAVTAPAAADENTAATLLLLLR